MALIYAGGAWRNVPDTAKANAQSPKASPTYVSGEGSIIAQAPELYDPGRSPVGVAQPETYQPEKIQPGKKTIPQGTQDTTPVNTISAAESARRLNAIAAMRGLLSQYGLSSLMGKVTQYVQDGYNDPDALMALIRTTPEYKERFPAMEALIREGRPITEGAYIEFERSAAELERMYGLPAGMIDDRDTITNLLSNDVSARELEQRVTMAAAGAFQTTPEVKQQFQDFYGINAGGLTAYFLDPEKALPLLNKQYASAQIGAEGGYQGFDIQAGTAERLTEMGISREQARQGFQRASRFRPLSEGRGDIATTEQIIGSELMGQQADTRAIERAQAARRGRFQEGGGFTSTQQGARGIGSAETT